MYSYREYLYKNGTGWDAVGTDDCRVASLTYTISGATTGLAQAPLRL